MTTADLIRELQDTRPVADDALRSRVRQIALRQREPRAFARLGGWRRLALVAVPAAAALALVTAGAVGIGRSGDHTRIALEPTAPEASAGGLDQAQPALPQGKTAATPPGTVVAPTGGRAARYTADLTLEVRDTDALSAATQSALRITRDLGGYVVTVSYGTTDTGASSMTLRVPTARVQDAVTRLTSLGTIVQQQVQIDDLQAALDASDREIAVLRSRLVHVQALLTATDLTAERRAQLEAQRGRLQVALRNEIAARASTAQEARFATLQLGIRTASEGTGVPVPSRLHRAIDQALGVLAWEGVVALAAIIAAAPFAFLLAALWLVRRAWRRHDEARLLAAP